METMEEEIKDIIETLWELDASGRAAYYIEEAILHLLIAIKELDN